MVIEVGARVTACERKESYGIGAATTAVHAPTPTAVGAHAAPGQMVDNTKIYQPLLWSTSRDPKGGERIPGTRGINRHDQAVHIFYSSTYVLTAVGELATNCVTLLVRSL